jgi:hypothetical protein
MKQELSDGRPGVQIDLDLQGLDDSLPTADIAEARPGMPSVHLCFFPLGRKLSWLGHAPNVSEGASPSRDAATRP